MSVIYNALVNAYRRPSEPKAITDSDPQRELDMKEVFRRNYVADLARSEREKKLMSDSAERLSAMYG